MKTSRRIGPRIRALREDRGLDVGQLAYKTGLHASTIHKIEAGDRPNASGTALALLADALGTTVDYLLWRTNDPSPILNPPGTSTKVRRHVAELLEAWTRLEQVAPDQLDAAANLLATQTELLITAIELERRARKETPNPTPEANHEV